MERQTFIQPGQDVKLQVLGDDQYQGIGRLLDVDQKHARISFAHPLPFGCAVRIEADDVLLLGEVTASVAGPEDAIVAIKMRQIIPSMSNLARLVSAVIGASPRQEIGRTQPETDRRAAS